MNKTIEYPFTRDYVKHWGRWEAIRELLQNAFDSSNSAVGYNDGRMVITNEGVIGSLCWLFGTSDKDSDDAIGQFGEGMKLAMLVLARENIPVMITSGQSKYWVEFGYSDTFNAEVVKLNLVELGNNVDLTIVEITIPESEYKEYQEYFLEDRTPRIIRDGKVGRVFVGGLYVTTLSGMKYSYNFSPSQITLNRDRDIPSMYDIQNAAANLLSDDELLRIHLESRSEACQYIGTERLARHFFNIFPDTVPIGISEQCKLSPTDKTKKIMIVSDFLAGLIRRVYRMGVSFINYGTPVSRLERWLSDWGNHLPSNAVEELKVVINELKGKK
jgi:hypothetical protein